MISAVTVKLAPAGLTWEFYTATKTRPIQDIALDNYASYEILPCFAVDAEGQEAAEEVFNLTNDPGRQDEREQLYGTGRSLSMGDIVEVDGVNWLCSASGWRLLNL